jgi:hypothetical protein
MPEAPGRASASLIGDGAAEEPVDYDAFAHEPPFRPRHNRARMWTIAAILAALLMLAATAAISRFGLPTVGRGGIAAAKGTPLKIEEVRSQRVKLASGNDLVTVTGRITNPTAETQRVPQLRAELRDDQGRPVYQWSISAPAPELSAGASIPFNGADLSVPRGARKVHVTFGPLA